jgi:hypothetical protein
MRLVHLALRCFCLGHVGGGETRMVANQNSNKHLYTLAATIIIAELLSSRFCLQAADTKNSSVELETG